MSLKPAKETLLDRFERYVKIDTRSDENSDTYPSTDKQWDLLNLLTEELKSLGVKDASIDRHGYVTGTIPSNIDTPVPTIGFLAHVDTSPAITGTNVDPACRY